MNDPVSNPAHYKVGNFEVIDIIQARLTPEEFAGFLKGNRIKYCLRAGHKDEEIQDIEKECWYARRLVDFFSKNDQR